ncbi:MULTISPECIES: M48 family metallopeptidase [Psychrilyobacter]|uniref:M48 family peptidase n=1 Tax=Psychrilyobacter piezotolerans TaxID=2293438 RepID=A0ABX9KIQ8_9FUSO|nr:MULTISPECIES: M48 family metallopeptidase [Psychrilyobacter]MCS5420213.1 M48 family metallopeptidase [Psychrilyobacter sp. S5]NDI77238.1 M48 family metallopeptidase [Psychrilyobacter piezotolerans]RDE63296.1 M48 family peptidase [Psychrilyobacter sp. S5]REI41838.1 M48 family peptidase [Psychrilyobacter piezotolerans]
MKKLVLLFSLIFIISCSNVPVTERNQLMLVNESDIIVSSEKQYEEFLKENPPLNNKNSELVKKVGKNISVAVELYFKEKGQEDLLEGYDWKFNLVDGKDINAWCMPGGKVAFYTGILPVTKDELGLAVVMGHEVAHAVARHGSERLSHQIAVQTGANLLNLGLSNVQTSISSDLALQAYGVGTNLGILSYSRKHELEADRLGLIFMAMAGYDPKEAIEFWKRMAKLSSDGGNEFLSTHPSHEHRIEDIGKYLPEAMTYYNK